MLNADGGDAEWPTADVLVGNPPFVGGKRLRSSLGDTYVERLFRAYQGRVPHEADFVLYWVEKAWEAVSAEAVQRAGLVTTNSVRAGANRRGIAAAHCRLRPDAEPRTQRPFRRRSLQLRPSTAPPNRSSLELRP